MTIDETIQLLRFNNKNFADLDNKDLLQMSEWLEELKELRSYKEKMEMQCLADKVLFFIPLR